MNSDSNKPVAIFLMGPTASGKTGLAIELHRKFPVEIVSVDSSLVYRGMDIGTAKPTAEELVEAPHRLIDIRDPDEPYSAAEFCSDAMREMRRISESGRIPLLVGGTIFYFHSLEFGLSDLPAADPDTRRRIQQRIEKEGLAAAHARLRALDPVSGERIHENDSQRIERALEIIELTGQTPTQLAFAPDQQPELPFTLIKYALWTEDRKLLNPRIIQRFDRMLEQGLVDEVRGLLKSDWFDPNLPAMRMVGYRQVIEYLQGKCSYEDMRERAILATGQLAKRQMTWIRGYPGVEKIDCLRSDLSTFCIGETSGKLSELGIY
ncbi:MAG: tRNA (adenosine(37)-N6)-dimethylallyltransferase MiaA [Acidiferrobacterales bacterium]